MSANLDWMDDAACVGHPNPDLFFPISTGRASRIQVEQAERVCAQCPVQRQCGEHKKQTGAGSGVWGGRGGKDRVSASSGGPQGTAALHGTTSGYARHYKRGEKPCAACWSAHSRSGAPGGRSKMGWGR